MKLFVISFFLSVNLFMSVSISAMGVLPLPNNGEPYNGEPYDFIINFGFVHNGKFFFERGYLSCPPETEFPRVMENFIQNMYRYMVENEPEIFKERSSPSFKEFKKQMKEQDAGFINQEFRKMDELMEIVKIYEAKIHEIEAEFSRHRRSGHHKRRLKQYLFELEERYSENWREVYEKELIIVEEKQVEEKQPETTMMKNAIKQYEKERKKFFKTTCQKQAPEIIEGNEDFSKRMRHAFIHACVDVVPYCNFFDHLYILYIYHEIYALTKMLKQGITHNADQLKHQEKALVKNINSLKATVRSEVENDLIPQFSILMDKIADLEAKVNQLEQENRKKDIEMTILKEAVAKENAPQ
jgi:hypothetical protein